MADKYILSVTAGPSYDPATHSQVAVNNTKSPTRITGPGCTADIRVRIQNYRGLPHGSPPTSPYFSSTGPHEHDQYSIEFDFVPHQSVSGSDLVFGNDFDHPIRDKLPPGFSFALGIVKRVIDPGLDGDAYSDTPHLYGPLLSSVNVLRIGDLVDKGNGGKGPDYQLPALHKDDKEVDENDDKNDSSLAEGADGQTGPTTRDDAQLPDEAGKRKSWALTEAHRDAFTWQQGRRYRADFFNPYIDFNDFSLKLPGFSMSMVKYLDGSDSLRYTLKDRKTDTVFFVVVFTLLKTQDVDDEADDSGKQQQQAGNTAKPQPDARQNTQKPDSDRLDDVNDDDVD